MSFIVHLFLHRQAQLAHLFGFGEFTLIIIDISEVEQAQAKLLIRDISFLRHCKGLFGEGLGFTVLSVSHIHPCHNTQRLTGSGFFAG
ncbi:hypothetical protein ES703_118702 [subsurface metagenome]